MRKKIIIISLIAIVLALLAVFGILYLKKHKPNLQIGNSINATDLKQEFKEKISQKDLTSIPTNLPKEFKVTAGDCDKIKDEKNKNLCREYLEYQTALSSADIKKCQSLKSDLFDICKLKVIADKHESFEDCSSIKNQTIHDLCYNNAALFLYDKSYCDKLFNKQKMTECKEKLIAQRVDVNNIKQCGEITIPSLFSVCVNNNKSDCADFGDQELINKCESWRLFDSIIRNSEAKYCDILTIGSFKKVCNIYFQKNKYADSDGDGIGDRAELEQGTDPFTANPEFKDIKEAEKKAFSVNRYLAEIRQELTKALELK